MASSGGFTRGGMDRASRNTDTSGGGGGGVGGPPPPYRSGGAGTGHHGNLATAPPGNKHSGATNFMNVVNVVGRGDTSGVMATGASSSTYGPLPPPPPPQEHGGVVVTNSGKSTTPSSSDAHYKQQLRSGFIGLRASYSEKRKPQGYHHNAGTAQSNMLMHQRGSNKNSGASPNNDSSISNRHRDIRPYTQRGLRGENRGLYRSNSSLELENVDYMDNDIAPGMNPLRRDYGSTSSLDVMGNNGESFFEMIQGYKQGNVDQRAPAPPQMQALLKPRSPSDQGRVKELAHSTSAHMLRLTQKLDNIQNTPSPVISNGSVPSEDQTDNSNNSQGSPKLRSKSQKNKDRKNRNKSVVMETSTSSGGLFKKLRGGKSEHTVDPDRPDVGSSAIDSEQIQEERLRRKAFLFYDCQSLGVNLPEVIRRRNTPASELWRNVSTGASAASSSSKSSAQNTPDSNKDMDPGDGKSNDLVQSCPFFRNELGREEERCVALCRTTAMKRTQHLLGNNQHATEALQRHPVCNGIAVLDCSLSASGRTIPSIQSHHGLVVEYADHGASYYRHYFHEHEHQNFFGIDENIGPVAISLRRERLEDYPRPSSSGSGADKTGANAQSPSPLYHYRIIARTSELATLRGSIPEDFIPSTSRLSNSRGLPAKDVLDFVLPDVNPACLRLGTNTDKTYQQLKKLDEQGITRHYKIGVMYYRPNQNTEEEAYNNESGSPAFEEFLDCIGRRVRLQDFSGYRGGLDCKTDSTGTHSLYTQIMDYEIMFHVSTMLPYTPTNRQQLLRKRHIGNDIVTLVFQEPDSLPFTPKSIRSHFQHVFIVVRVHNPNTENVTYSIAVTRSKEVPPFGPPIPDGAVFKKGPQFAEFLKMKMINAENAVHKSAKFTAMATRTREEYLKDLANNHVTTTTLEQSSKTSKFSLSSRKKEKGKQLTVPDVNLQGAIVWVVQLEDFGQNRQLTCYLGMAVNTIVFLDIDSQEVVFLVPCKAVIGWSSGVDSLQIYYDHGELVSFKTIYSKYEEIREIVSRLKATTLGMESKEMSLRRNSQGQLGFHVHYEGMVSDVEHYGPAWQVGLRNNYRLVEVCKIATATLTHDQMVDLLRTSQQVNVVVIPSHDDGTPRRGVDELRSSHTAFLNHHTQQRHSEPDQSSDSGSSRSTVRSQHAPPPLPPNRSIPDSRYLALSNNTSTTTNTHPAQIYSDHQKTNSGTSSSTYGELRHVSRDKNHLSTVSHSHQSSHDSAGSRSSGHGSDGNATLDPYHQRPDNLSSEGFVSGGDSPERGDQHRAGGSENAGRNTGEWSGQVRYLPAYGKDNPLNNNGPLSPSSSSTSHWSNYESLATNPNNAAPHNNNSKTSLKGGSKNLSFRNLAPRPYKAPQSKDRSSFAEPQSNVYGTSAPSNNSSETRQYSLRQNPINRHLDDYNQDSKRIQSSSSGSSSSPQSTLQQSSRQRLEGSPRDYRRNTVAGRNLAHGASSENLSGSGNSGGRSQRHPARKDSKGNLLTTSNFEADLKRLIDTDVSFSDNADRDDQFSTTSSGGGRQRYNQQHYTRGSPNTNSATHNQRSQRLMRTLSDESMCGTVTVSPRLRHRTIGGVGGGGDMGDVMRRRALGNETSDVIFTTAVPAQVVAMHSPSQYGREQRSPSAHNLSGSTNALPTLSTMTQPHTKSNPSIPLPDPGSGLDWNNLVNTATKALQHGSDQRSGAPSDTSTEYGGSRGKSGRSKGGTGPASAVTANQGSAQIPRANSFTTKSNAIPQDQATSERIQELENRVQQLEQELERERMEKQDCQDEVGRLQQDNVRLQHESQTAAAQLRKFTEWFFQTIDRQ